MDDAPRVGTVRPSMQTNPLIVQSALGQPKHANIPKFPVDHAYGYSIPKDPEGARELMGIWKEHKAPEKVQQKISPHVTVKPKQRQSSPKKATLPSDKNLSHTYGMPSAHRSAEVVRSKGEKEASIKMLIQGAFSDEWIATHLEQTKANQASAQAYIPPVPTRATIGHAIGAQRYLKQDEAGEEWKMSKFRDVPSRITQYMT